MNKNKIRCNITGRILGVSKDILQKRITKYGSEEELRQTYISREAKKLLREGKSVAEIRQLHNAPSDLPDIPDDILNKKWPKQQKSSSAATPEQKEPSIDSDISEFLKLGETLEKAN